MPPGGVRVPRLRESFRRADADQVLQQAGWDPGNSGPTIAASVSFTEVQARLWSQATTSRAAAALIYHSMASRHDVVRTVSAAEVLRLAGTADPQAVGVLMEAFTSSSMTVQAIAASALEMIQPDHPALRKLTENTVRPAKTAAEASLLVHGTFSRLRSNWWRPGGDFFEYLKTKVSPNLYDAPDHFRWSGRYTQGHREAGGQDLAAWTDAASITLDTVFAHSHGGNVALDAAARNGVRMRLLVLLSTPAFKEGKKAAEQPLARHQQEHRTDHCRASPLRPSHHARPLAPGLPGPASEDPRPPGDLVQPQRDAVPRGMGTSEPIKRNTIRALPRPAVLS
jgi:pimeloyl-ACP methyl ester carboxylesterase